MPSQGVADDRIEGLKKAFEQDGFEVVASAKVDVTTTRVGLLAKHRTAKNKGIERKRAYYVEGSPWEMGYLMGRLAERTIHHMSENYIENYIRQMIPWAANRKWREKDWPLYDWLVKRVNDLVPAGVPPHESLRRRIAEIQGMVAGCREVNPATEVTEERLWMLNAGVDCIFSLVYEHKLLSLLDKKKAAKIQPLTACNGLAVLNDAADDGALFARDFMFAACDVFQDAACLVIYNTFSPDPGDPLPIVSMTAPGFVGSISAMNTNGVAAGVDVVHGGNNHPDHLGINSLLLVRHVVESGPTIEEAARQAWSVPRGVTWLYPMAGHGEDGRDRACVVEASATPRDESGMPVEELDFLSYPREELRREGLLPTREYLTQNVSKASPYHSGVMVRWENFEDPCGDRGYGSFNEGLWTRTKAMEQAWKKVRDQLGPEGMINAKHTENRCPSGSYFAPLRAEPGNIVLTSNHYVCPEMRLTAMDERCTRLDSRYASDSQWRYDELNRLVQRARWYDEETGTRLDVPNRIGGSKAKELINFLEPRCTNARCPFTLPGYCFHYKKYHSKACRSRWARKKEGMDPVEIEGAISLFNFKYRTIESYFGYYGDPWVKLQLMNYVE
ncbi:hypothetical protein KJ567_07300 [Candidatus Bipolaricaulota bacterium]|nr:hypothetical protein [Candidatus Bipolaricaulota bacterium]